MTIANLQEVCFKLVVLARARAHEFQVDMQVECAHQTPLPRRSRLPPSPRQSQRIQPINLSADSFSSLMNAGMEIIANMQTHAQMVSVCHVGLRPIVCKIAPVPADNSLRNRMKPSLIPKEANISTTHRGVCGRVSCACSGLSRCPSFNLKSMVVVWSDWQNVRAGFRQNGFFADFYF